VFLGIEIGGTKLQLGVGEGDSIAIFCRDHRGFVQASVAASKLGASLLLLNTSFAGRQIAEVCAAFLDLRHDRA